MKSFSTVSGKKLAFSILLGEHFFGVNYGTFSVYVFPKFDEKNYSIGFKTEKEQYFFSILLILL